MNGDYQEGARGASVKPSARRSIHSRSDNMGRYGLSPTNAKSKPIPPANEQYGTDEVDNIMSKPVRESSPLVIRNTKIQRSNSCPMDDETDDDDNVLSKSLPSTLPSHLYSSDNTDLEEQNSSAVLRESHQRQTNTSNRSFDRLHLTLERSNNSQLTWTDESYNHQRTPRFQRKPSVSSPKRQNEARKSPMSIIIALVIVIPAVLYYFVTVNNSTIIESLLSYNSYTKSTQTVNYEMLFEKNIRDLQKKYNIDRDSILKLKTGISTISERMDAGSFIFIYNSNTNNFDISQFDKFINEVASATARYLRNDTASLKHTELTSYRDIQEHGELIDMYRDAVGKSGVLLVKEVDAVPSELAMAFHYYCDEYQPVVKRSAIFFTLNLANCSNSDEKRKSIHEYIEKCLARKWKTVPPENMRPLLTRLVDIVIDVTSVF